MNLNKIKHLSPLNQLVYWIKERESIRLKKEGGKKAPWTDDPILGTYRFCNVRRMDDKVSRWLMTNWYRPNFNHPYMPQAVALARFVNKPESLILLTDEVFSRSKPDWIKVKAILRKRKEAGEVVWNAAYMVRGQDGADKIASVVDSNVKTLDAEIDRTSMENTCKAINACHGFGSFMAGQVTADLRWAMQGTWKDKMTWAPIGPGSRRGMNVLQGRSPFSPLNQAKFLKELKELHKTLCKEVDSKIMERLELHDVQNCCCEFWKFNRTLTGQGKPKQLYHAN